MDLDLNSLLVSLLFGLIGGAMLVYGVKTRHMVPLVVGGILSIVPYFITNMVVLVVVCCALTAIPWFLREA